MPKIFHYNMGFYELLDLMLHIMNQLKENTLSFPNMTSLVTFLSIASHTGSSRCTKVMLQICNNWLERVKNQMLQCIIIELFVFKFEKNFFKKIHSTVKSGQL